MRAGAIASRFPVDRQDMLLRYFCHNLSAKQVWQRLALRRDARREVNSVWFESIVRAVLRAVPVVMMSALAFGAAVAAPTALTDLVGNPVVGTWQTLDGTEISVQPCEQDFCGYLTWVVIPKDLKVQCEQMDHAAFSAELMDIKNPDKAMQTRPILGLHMLTAKPTSDPANFTASIYNPTDGSTNDVQLFVLNGGTTLRIGGGCVGSMCAITQDWPKVPTREGPPDYVCPKP